MQTAPRQEKKDGETEEDVLLWHLKLATYIENEFGRF